MSNTETVLNLLPSDVLDDGFHVTGWPKATEIGGGMIILVDGHWGNGVVTTRRWRSNATVNVSPSC